MGVDEKANFQILYLSFTFATSRVHTPTRVFCFLFIFSVGFGFLQCKSYKVSYVLNLYVSLHLGRDVYVSISISMSSFEAQKTELRQRKITVGVRWEMPHKWGWFNLNTLKMRWLSLGTFWGEAESRRLNS